MALELQTSALSAESGIVSRVDWAKAAFRAFFAVPSDNEARVHATNHRGILEGVVLLRYQKTRFHSFFRQRS